MIRERIKTFIGDSSGAAFVWVAFMMLSIVGFAGLAIDVGHWYAVQRSAQVATDSAAVAGAFEAMWGGDAAAVVAAAEDQAVANGFAASLVTVNSPPSSGPNTADAKAVEVIIQSPTAGLFSSVVGSNEVNIASRSVASLVDGSPTCLVALNPSDQAINLNSNSHIIANGCGIHANSSNSAAIETTSGSSVTAEEITVVGGTSGSGISPTPETGVDVVPDPLGYLQPPAVGSCTNPGRDYEVTETIYPGVYCGDHVFKAGSDVTMAGGLYIFTGDKVEAENGANLRTNPGDGVTIYLEPDLQFIFNSGTHIALEAPTTGDYPGLLIYSESDLAMLINSDSSSTLLGVVYVPNGKIMINSGSSLGGTAPFSAFVAKEFELNSDSTVTFNANYSATTVPGIPTLGARKVAIFE